MTDLSGQDASPKPALALGVAYRLELWLGQLASRIARRAGWTPAVLPYPGYGGGGRLRVLGRVLLAPAHSNPSGRSDVAGWRRFLTLEQPGAAVDIEVAGAHHEARSGEAGLLDTIVEAAPPTGPVPVRLHVPGRDAVTAMVHVAPAGHSLGVVCDIDDTVWITGLNTPLRAAWRTLAHATSRRHPVPGMSVLLQGLLARDRQAPVVYLSTGAWNLAGPIAAFMERHQFPPGALLLTDWGLSPRGWFRDGSVHKRTCLERLNVDLPNVRWVLVGDDGQHDPDIYRDFATAHPERVAAIALRQVDPGARPPRDAVEQVAGVPILWGADGAQLLPRLRSVLPPQSG
jgi:phosphatidate phosphatase APP1